MNIIMVIFTLTAGSAVLMWIGERITEKGVGNGISIVLTINIISRMPNDIGTLYHQLDWDIPFKILLPIPVPFPLPSKLAIMTGVCNKD